MSPPSGFPTFCAFHGVSLVPAQWDVETRAAYRAWKLRHFRAHVRHYRDLGQWDIIRQQSGRARLIEMVRAELARALEPPPPDVYGRAEGRLPLRRDVGGKSRVGWPVMLGVYARLEAASIP